MSGKRYAEELKISGVGCGEMQFDSLRALHGLRAG